MSKKSHSKFCKICPPIFLAGTFPPRRANPKISPFLPQICHAPPTPRAAAPPPRRPPPRGAIQKLGQNCPEFRPNFLVATFPVPPAASKFWAVLLKIGAPPPHPAAPPPTRPAAARAPPPAPRNRLREPKSEKKSHPCGWLSGFRLFFLVLWLTCWGWVGREWGNACHR